MQFPRVPIVALLLVLAIAATAVVVVSATGTTTCKSCSGGVTAFEFAFEPKQKSKRTYKIECRQYGSNAVIASFKNCGHGFRFQVKGKGKDGIFGKSLSIYVDGRRQAEIITDCSKSCNTNSKHGNFRIISADSRHGRICDKPDEDDDDDDDDDDEDDEDDDSDCNNDDTAPCGDCKGKITFLTLKVEKPGVPAGTKLDIVVKQKDGKSSTFYKVPNGNTITVVGKDGHGTCSDFISLYINCKLNAKISTSCSQKIGPGSKFGDFTIVEGKSKYGGKLCPPPSTPPPAPTCGECNGKVKSLALVYNDPASTKACSIVVRQSGYYSNVASYSNVNNGFAFTIQGRDSYGTLGSKTYFYVNNCLRATIDTSCCTPIGPGTQAGPFLVTAGASKLGGALCPIENPPPVCKPCDGGVSKLRIRLVHPTAADGTTFRVVARESYSSTPLLTLNNVANGQEFEVQGTNSGGKIGTNLYISLNDVPNASFHTSCSQPIGPNSRSGNFLVVSGSSVKGGLLCDVPEQTPPECAECKGTLTSLTLRFYRPSASSTAKFNLKVIESGNKVPIFRADGVSRDFTFTVVGTNKDASFRGDIAIYIDDCFSVSFDNDCKNCKNNNELPGPGVKKGDFTIVSGTSNLGGLLCPVPPPPEDCADKDDYRTFTPEDYGQGCSWGNCGCYRDTLFAWAFPHGLVVGYKKSGSFYAEFTSSYYVRTYLPCSGTAAKLSKSFKNPSCWDLKNSLVSSTMALAMNIRFDAVYESLGKENVDLENAVVKAASSPCKGWTVGTVLDKANCVLSGASNCGLSAADALSCANTINNAFVDGKPNGDVCISKECTKNCTSTDVCYKPGTCAFKSDGSQFCNGAGARPNGVYSDCKPARDDLNQFCQCVSGQCKCTNCTKTCGCPADYDNECLLPGKCVFDKYGNQGCDYDDSYVEDGTRCKVDKYGPTKWCTCKQGRCKCKECDIKKCQSSDVCVASGICKFNQTTGAEYCEAGSKLNGKQPGCGGLIDDEESAHPPSDAIHCAHENGKCVLPHGVTASVWYGAGSHWALETGVTGFIYCNNHVFGDPIRGTVKSCRYKVRPDSGKKFCSCVDGECKCEACTKDCRSTNPCVQDGICQFNKHGVQYCQAGPALDDGATVKDQCELNTPISGQNCNCQSGQCRCLACNATCTSPNVCTKPGTCFFDPNDCYNAKCSPTTPLQGPQPGTSCGGISGIDSATGKEKYCECTADSQYPNKGKCVCRTCNKDCSSTVSDKPCMLPGKCKFNADGSEYCTAPTAGPDGPKPGCSIFNSSSSCSCQSGSCECEPVVIPDCYENNRAYETIDRCRAPNPTNCASNTPPPASGFLLCDEKWRYPAFGLLFTHFAGQSNNVYGFSASNDQGSGECNTHLNLRWNSNLGELRLFGTVYGGKVNTASSACGQYVSGTADCWVVDITYNGVSPVPGQNDLRCSLSDGCNGAGVIYPSSGTVADGEEIDSAGLSDIVLSVSNGANNDANIFLTAALSNGGTIALQVPIEECSEVDCGLSCVIDPNDPQFSDKSDSDLACLLDGECTLVNGVPTCTGLGRPRNNGSQVPGRCDFGFPSANEYCYCGSGQCNCEVCDLQCTAPNKCTNPGSCAFDNHGGEFCTPGSPKTNMLVPGFCNGATYINNSWFFCKCAPDAADANLGQCACTPCTRDCSAGATGEYCSQPGTCIFDASGNQLCEPGNFLPDGTVIDGQCSLDAPQQGKYCTCDGFGGCSCEECDLDCRVNQSSTNPSDFCRRDGTCKFRPDGSKFCEPGIPLNPGTTVPGKCSLKTPEPGQCPGDDPQGSEEFCSCDGQGECVCDECTLDCKASNVCQLDRICSFVDGGNQFCEGEQNLPDGSVVTGCGLNDNDPSRLCNCQSGSCKCTECVKSCPGDVCNAPGTCTFTLNGQQVCMPGAQLEGPQNGTDCNGRRFNPDTQAYEYCECVLGSCVCRPCNRDCAHHSEEFVCNEPYVCDFTNSGEEICVTPGPRDDGSTVPGKCDLFHPVDGSFCNCEDGECKCRPCDMDCTSPNKCQNDGVCVFNPDGSGAMSCAGFTAKPDGFTHGECGLDTPVDGQYCSCVAGECECEACSRNCSAEFDTECKFGSVCYFDSNGNELCTEPENLPDDASCSDIDPTCKCLSGECQCGGNIPGGFPSCFGDKSYPAENSDKTYNDCSPNGLKYGIVLSNFKGQTGSSAVFSVRGSYPGCEAALQVVFNNETNVFRLFGLVYGGVVTPQSGCVGGTTWVAPLCYNLELTYGTISGAVGDDDIQCLASNGCSGVGVLTELATATQLTVQSFAAPGQDILLQAGDSVNGAIPGLSVLVTGTISQNNVPADASNPSSKGSFLVKVETESCSPTPVVPVCPRYCIAPIQGAPNGRFGRYGAFHAFIFGASGSMIFTGRKSENCPDKTGLMEVDEDAGRVRMTGDLVFAPGASNIPSTFSGVGSIDVSWVGIRDSDEDTHVPKLELFLDLYQFGSKRLVNTKNWRFVDILEAGSKFWYTSNIKWVSTDLSANPFKPICAYSITQMGPDLQIGYGANGKNLQYGASSWFFSTFNATLSLEMTKAVDPNYQAARYIESNIRNRCNGGVTIFNTPSDIMDKIMCVATDCPAGTGGPSCARECPASNNGGTAAALNAGMNLVSSQSYVGAGFFCGACDDGESWYEPTDYQNPYDVNVELSTECPDHPPL